MVPEHLQPLFVRTADGSVAFATFFVRTVDCSEHLQTPCEDCGWFRSICKFIVRGLRIVPECLQTVCEHSGCFRIPFKHISGKIRQNSTTLEEAIVPNAQPIRPPASVPITGIGMKLPKAASFDVQRFSIKSYIIN